MALTALGLQPHWDSAPVPSPPASTEVHLWRVALDAAPAARARLAAFLSPAERERAARFRFQRDQRHYVVCRGSLRLLLGRYLRTDAARLRFRVGPAGKPQLSDATTELPLHFNVSHADGLAVIAVTSGREVGVDIERVRAFPDLPALASRFFSPAENAALLQLPAALQTLGFYRCWTGKEAVIKCTGEGLSRPLASFDVVVHPQRSPALLRLEGEPDSAREWTLRALDPAREFMGTVAVRGRVDALRQWRLPDPGSLDG